MATIGKLRPLYKNDPDPVFAQIRFEAEEALRREPELGGFLASSILNHATLEQAVGHRLAARLSHSDVPGDIIRQNFLDLAEREGLRIGNLDVQGANLEDVFLSMTGHKLGEDEVAAEEAEAEPKKRRRLLARGR